MVVPEPPLSWKQNKDDLILTASTHSPTPKQRFSQFKGSSSSLTSQGDSAIPDEDIVRNTETSHLSNLTLFARSKTRSECVSADIYSRYSKVKTGSQRSSNLCQRKKVRNKNLNCDIKYGIACAIPELYDEGTYSCQDSEYSYSDTSESYYNQNNSLGVDGFSSSSRYKTSNFPLISVGKGPQHQEGEGEGTLFYQSTYNTQNLPETSSVASGSSKKSLKNKNSQLRKEAFSASRSVSVQPFCLYGKIIHTDDCKCFKINLWKRCLLPGCDKVSNTDTFCNVYQNNLDEDVSSLGEEITADTSISVSHSKSVTENIHSGQFCTQKLEPVCEFAKETDDQWIQYGLETDWGIGEEITQQYNSEIADLRVISPETALPLIHQTPNYSPREQSQSPFVSESESLETFRHTYDNVKNLPLESRFKGKVQQVTESSPRSTWSEATSGLAQSLYKVADFVQYTQTKNDIKSSERPAKENNLESCLALFDNLLIDIDNQLERQVSHTSENSIAEQFGLYPWAALDPQGTTTMASQGKKNKNQFVRKAAPASPVNNADVTSKEIRLSEVSVDCSSHGMSQKDMNVTKKIELTQGSPPEFVLEQHGMPPDSGVHDAHRLLGQNSSLGGISTPSVNIHYSEQSSSVPEIHSHPYSSPSTGSTIHSEKIGTPNHDETQSPVPPAKPPRTFVSDTMGQHSASSTHKESTQMFGNTKQQQSSRLQRQGSQQFANNFDDDGQGYHERLATDNPLTVSDEDIQFNYLEEQARIQYEGPETWSNNGQMGNANQSTYLQTQVGQDFPFHMNAQEDGQYNSGHMANKTHYSSKEHKQSGHHKGAIPRVPNAGKMGQTSSSHQDNWMDEMGIGQSGGQMEQQQSWQDRGYHGDEQQDGLGQMPDTEHGRSLQPAQRGSHAGKVGPMHPHAQSNEMQVNEQGFNENVLVVQDQQSSKVQDHNIPKDHRHGNGQSGDGVSDYTRKSTYISDRELAQEQFDQRMNNPWFQEMVQNMKELVEKEGLIVKDVFPDGNCLFTAVVDQLRVRGNFKYTPSTLRAAAVNYLRENSKQRDGTPLEHFLSNETWEHYLGRMSRDGEWGEHIILGAISEVLRCRINVLGGMSGKSFTVVQPQYMSDKEEEEREKERKETKGDETPCDSQTADKTISENPTADTAKSDKSPSNDETNSETSQSKTGSKPATPHACEQSKSLHTGSASLSKPTDAEVESTDTSQRKDQTGFRSKQNWDKENEELSQGEALFIGLLGEMHYVSLRKKDWEERLHEKLWARIQKREAQRKERSEEGALSDDDMCLPEGRLSQLFFFKTIFSSLAKMLLKF
ncbi:hypothetical protein ACJMK2_024790 [Sinanodonta woodiana]|uniref:OTU domain-containing protein n=1 Tax=Sinanodonta woodiana TaxID=1069815 RepID=A0ABD3XEJ5_SINWO